MSFMATAIWGVMSPEKSSASLPAAGSFSEREGKQMKSTKNFGLDQLIERAQAWNDASTRYPVVQVVGNEVRLIRDGVLLAAFPASSLTGFISRLESARESVRVQSMMERDWGRN